MLLRNLIISKTHTILCQNRRSFSLLGFDEYYESFADGLQVLRYNESKAYTPHHDYFSGYFPNDYHDYDSTHVGTNRFATILLYMNGVGKDGQGEAIEGGETVFPDVTPEGSLSKEQVCSNCFFCCIIFTNHGSLFKGIGRN